MTKTQILEKMEEEGLDIEPYKNMSSKELKSFYKKLNEEEEEGSEDLNKEDEILDVKDEVIEEVDNRLYSGIKFISGMNETTDGERFETVIDAARHQYIISNK